ncbi:Tyrocidine synthetase 1 [Mycena venus]|uniref:Tyrocidine synthetase 1 n=1 Tax=Mycena venus TaxID=2733690 RepID=A0A8H7D7Z6_9AGAR|nr:Tyrocidine synthetase 1 [Mycena venus]
MSTLLLESLPGFSLDQKFAHVPVTPVQELILRSGNRSWVATEIRLPSTTGITLESIQQAWIIVASRNDILRTSVRFAFDPGFLVLGDIAEVLLRDHPLDRCADFDSAHLIVTLAPEKFRVILHMPELLIDERSLRLIEHDLALCHSGATLVARVPSPDPFFSYVAEVHARDTEAARAHWKAILAGVHPSRSPFPTTAAPELTGTRKEIVVDAGTDAILQLRAFADEYATGDIFTVLQATWALVLGTHMGIDDVTFAVVLRDACNSVYPAHRVVGRMDITFPTHARVDRAAPLIALFESLKHAQDEGEQHGYIGFDRILEQWDVPRPSIFSALRICARGNHSTARLAFEDGAFPLSLRFGVLNSFRLDASFDSSFGEGQIRVLLDHFLAALQSMLSLNAFAAKAADVNILSSTERTKLVEQAAPRAPMRRELIHRLIEARAAVDPQAVAIEELDSWRAWTIGEINRFGNIVARQLGECRKAIIPVCLDRSAHLVIALLAILKTGSAYVILDPEHPQERLRLILEDIKAPFVISSAKLASRFDIPVKNIATLLSTPTPDHNIHTAIDGRDLAYIVYTSGSSGRPKGVELTHSAATTGILAATPSSDLRSLLFFNPIFSAAQRTIWLTIISGGILCLASKGSLISDLAGCISKLRVNTIGVTTTTASLLTPQDAPTLKTVILTGERVTDAVVERWADAVDLRSGYGLSECTQLAWSKSLSRNAPANKIDRPLDSTSAFVLIPETTTIAARLVPGELCLAGPQLARGYLNLSDLTSSVFIPNPFGEGRLYRTGDKAVYHDDGSIELLGRIDRQVKVAGQRVDPEEVESVLLQHVSVKTAAVQPVSLSGVTALVACVVFEGDVDESLVHHAQERLPPFALPSYWLQHDLLPTTVTGKVAHAALRAQLSLLSREDLLFRSFISSSALPASTPEELALSTACAQILGISESFVSMNASFIVLGGTSLQAIQLCTLLRKNGWVVGVSDIIQSPTLSALATLLVVADVATTAVPEPFSLVDRSSIDNDTVDWSLFEDIYPASALQEGLIGATLSGNKDYLYQRVYDISGKDIPRLRSALERVFRDDATLRTTFFPSGSSILQGVLPATTPLPWTEVPTAISLDEFKKQDLAVGVHLGSPFWRVAFLPAAQILVISSHHALFDFWSNSFSIDDAARIYDGQAPIERPPYKTFIRHLQTVNRDDSKKFWTEYLQNASPAYLNIMEPAKGSVIARSLPNISPELQKAHGITLGTLIYTAWALVLRIHNTSPADVTFATTLAARDLPIANLDVMNGPTLTTVPQRVHFPDIESLTTLELLKSVQTNLWGMMSHAQYGMRDALQLAEAKTSLFNTMVNIVTKNKQEDANAVFVPYGPPPVWRTEYVSLEVALPDVPGAPVDVKLVSAMGEREAEFVMEQFVNAFAAVSAPMSAKVIDLRLLSAAELAFLESRAGYETPTDAVIHAAMEAIALATPERPALEWEDGTVVSYGELNAKADRVAAALIERGVGPDVLVPLCVDKSIEMIVAIYGILKAGGAYVPLDPENPAERNRFICQDVEAVVGVTVPQHAHIFDEQLPLIILDGVARKSVNVRGEHEELKVSRTLLLFESKGSHDGRKWRLITGSRPPSPTGLPPPAPTSSNLAYAIYTSGSTGAPKGVLINHSCICTFITGRIRAEGYQPSWRTLLFANYVFDVSVSDIFVALSVGAVLCLASMESLMTNLYACIESFKANQISLTPTVARLLPAVPPSLTHMVLGGEPCSAELVAMFAPHLTLFNSYGPTETTVYCTWGDMPPEKSPRIIGFPMYGVGSMILQPGTMDVVPYGAIGEYCVLGPYVARGYLNRPESNAKSFIKWTNGERMYRTGDLIRWEASGELGCYGRRDNQVKIAGHRMELGEIEHAITATGIGHGRSVVVLTVAGKPQLGAFVLMEPEIEEERDLELDEESIILPPTAFVDEITSLRTTLGTALPPYMVPKFWIPVTRFPITAGSRKIDGALLARLGNALPDINKYGSVDSAQGPYVECSTPVEFALRDLWVDILQIDLKEIGATSSFFHFGGDSITAISLVGKCRSRGVGALSVGDVLANPLLKDMAAKVKQLSAGAGAAVAKTYMPLNDVYELAGVGKDDVEEILAAGPGQIEFLEFGGRPEKFWLLQTTRELPAEVDTQRWIEVTTELTRRNPILRTTFVKDVSGKWLQVVLKSTAPHIKEVEVADEIAMRAVVAEEWENEFAKGEPWVRYCIVKLADGRRFLLHRVSHAVYDGTSLRVLDVQFTAIARGEPVPTVPTFNAFIHYTETLDREQRLAFWRKILEGSTFSYPSSPSVASPACNTIHLVHLDNSIDACGPKHGVTVPIVFQTAFSLLLARLSGGTDIAYDSLVTGRDLPVEDAQEMSGACATFLPFRVQFGADTALSALLKSTQAIFWETNEHGDIPIMDIMPSAPNRCLFLFQPFEPNKAAAADPMRWCVLGMSKVRQEMNYALMMEVFRAPNGYVVRLRHDNRVFGKAEIEAVGDQLRAILDSMVAIDGDAEIKTLI